MSDWRTRLREADAERFALFRPDDVVRVRGDVLAAAAQPGAARRRSSAPLGLVAAMSVLVLAAVGAAWQTGMRGKAASSKVDRVLESPPDASRGDEIPAVERQQLQFATPGGTRIIWVFDPAFELKGTMR